MNSQPNQLDTGQVMRHVQEVERMNRLYAVLSQVNQAVVRAESRQEVFDKVCRAALTYGGFKLAWIGWLDSQTREVRPVALGGESAPALREMRILVDDCPEGRGPTGTAIREGRTVVCNDLMHDPVMAPWHALAAQQGVGSAASFPIRLGNEVCGALVLYAAEPGFFREQEISLLEEAASDVSFSLSVLEKDAQRRRAEQSLRAQSTLLAATLDSSPNGILVVDGQMKKVLQNRRMNELWKIPPEIANDQDDTKQIQFVTSRVKSPTQFCERVAHLYAHPEESAREEIELVDGTVLDRNTAPIVGQDGQYSGRIWTFRDITEQRRHEQEIGRMNQLYSVLSQVNQAVVRAGSRQEVFDRVCRAALTYDGFRIAWIGWLDRETRAINPVAQDGPGADLLNEIRVFADDRPEGKGPTGVAVREGRTAVINDFANDPATEPWRALFAQHGIGSAAAFPIRVGEHVCGALALYAAEPGFFRERELMLLEEAASDVSFALHVQEKEAQRRQAEDLLRASEQRYRSLFENMLEGFAYCRMLYDDGQPLDFVYLEVNHAFERLSGLKEVTGKKVSEVIPGIRESNPEMFQVYGRVALTGIPEKLETCVKSLGIWFSIAVYSPVPEHFVAIFDNITEPKRAEEALRARESMLATILKTAQDGFWLLDAQGRFLDVNDAYCVASGYRREELLQMGITDVEVAESPEQTRAHIAQVMSAGSVRFETKHRRRDGSIMEVEISATYLPSTGDRLVAFLRDITERKCLEAQLRQAQKLEAVGQLAGGVAHDFNNILAAQFLQIGFLQERPELPDDIRESLELLETGARMASDLTRQLLAFSRRQVLKPQRLDFDKVISNLLKMLRRVLGEDITLRFEPALNSLWLDADAGMMEQVLMNLVVNARDAMPKGGQLVIRTEEVLIPDSAPLLHPDARSGRFIRLSVADSGCGMTAEVQQRIFEPFFTTKEPGKGTGLGLATVFGIVKQHQGWIEAESQSGAGTTFQVHFPAVLVPAVLPVDQKKSGGLPRGSETILLVEDEKNVRVTLRRALELLGYRVLEAANADEATKVWTQHGQEIRLLITDMIMPGSVNGLQLAEQLCAARPGLRVIVCSGYSHELADLPNATLKVVRLAKPFELRSLAETLRQELDRR